MAKLSVPNVCLVTQYEEGTGITAERMDLHAAKNMNLKAFDMAMAACLGKPLDWWDDNGKWTPCRVGIGPSPLSIIECVQLAAPIYSTIEQIADGCDRPQWVNNRNAFHRHMSTIRTVLDETLFNRYFDVLYTPEYAIAWRPENSWIQIERLQPCAQESGAAEPAAISESQ